MEIDGETIEANLIYIIAIALFITGLLLSLVFFGCCCGCIFFSYFKFSSSIKDYDHIVQLTEMQNNSQSQIQMANIQGIPSGVPSGLPAASYAGVARGQVVGYPQLAV
jgi:hypothetical protein